MVIGKYMTLLGYTKACKSLKSSSDLACYFLYPTFWLSTVTRWPLNNVNHSNFVHIRVHYILNIFSMHN